MPLRYGRREQPASGGCGTWRVQPWSYAAHVPVDVEPPALARLLDFAERPRGANWSLRAALVRYAQPQPERVSEILDLVRRIEGALRPHGKRLERDGQAFWDALQAPAGSDSSSDANADLIELLRTITALDDLGDVLASWAVDIAGQRPDAEVERVIATVAQRLDALGVPREESTRQTRPRS
jgi:hypothetical protein